MAAVAALIGDPARSAMLHALCDARQALPAGELAACARVSPATASGHLARLLEGNLVAVEPNGRHRYYRLANAQVAAALEALALIAPPAPVRNLSHAAETTRVREARTCYDHLAGRLGVALTDGLCARGLLARDDLALTAAGECWFAQLGIEVDALRRGRRPLTRACLDWSERRHHLSGALGAAFAAQLLDRRWVVRRPEPRAVELTPAGRASLADLLAPEPG